MYYVLSNEIADEEKDAELSGDVNLELGGDISFERGEAVPTLPVPRIIYTMNDDSRMGRMTDHLSLDEAYGLVFSSRLRELLFDLKIENIQYFDLEIVNPETKEVYTDYKIANVVGLVDCVDKKKSDLKYFASGNIKRIRKLILNENRIPRSAKIFRLSNDVTLPIVHESVKKAFEVAGISGCLFYKVEDYH